MQTAVAEVRQPHLFEYQNPQKFLLDTLSWRQKIDSRFSARAWAKEMQLSSPSLLIMLLQGTRPLRLKHVDFISKGLRLSTPEHLYFRALIQFVNANSVEEKHLCEVWLSELNPGAQVRIKELDEYAVISKWVHTVIFTMTGLKNFSGSAEEIYEFLGRKVSINEIRSALLRLFDLNLIRKNEATGRVEATNQVISTRDDVSSKAVQEHHKQVLRLAEEAIEAQSVLEREFQAFSVAIESEKLPLAKEMIRRFKQQFIQAVGVKEQTADQVYQMNLQFFRLTECPSEKGLLENEDAVLKMGHTLAREGNA